MPITLEEIAASLADRFRVERAIGSGGWALVYLAEDLKHQRKVAIKVLRPELATAIGERRFLREIEVVAALRHPHILPLHDSGSADGLLYYVMPYVEGESLAERLKREGPLPIAEVIAVGREVAEALHYAHERGVVHRDVKPSNIMLEAGHAVVADFGIARLTRAVDAADLTHTGLIPGTPRYMSPEQAGAGPPVDGRSDLYSLGCVLFEALTGEPAFAGSNSRAVIARKMIDTPPLLRTIRDTVPERLERVVERSMARMPGDRFRTGRELAAALAAAAEPSPPAEAAAPEGWSRVSAWVGAAFLGGLFMIAVGFLTARALAEKLQFPPQAAPLHDPLTAGARALAPLVIQGIGILVLYALARYLVRLVSGGLGRVPGVGERTDEIEEAARSGWGRIAYTLRPKTMGELFFVGSVAASVVVLWQFWPLLSTLWTERHEILSCANRPVHRAFTLSMTALIAALSLGWYHAFGWLRARAGGWEGLRVSRWGTLAWIAMLILIMALPRGFLWETYERVRVDGDRAYVLREASESTLLYNADRGRVERAEGREVARLNLPGFLFEGAEAFGSGRRECDGVLEAS